LACLRLGLGLLACGVADREFLALQLEVAQAWWDVARASLAQA